MTLLAHIVQKENEILTQPLLDHIVQVGDMAGKIGNEVGIPAIMRVIGYLHDVGKADDKFQKYIIGNNRDHVNHSSAGGCVFLDLIDIHLHSQEDDPCFAYFKEVVSYCIFAHHGLFDQVQFREKWIIKYDERIRCSK